MHCKKIYLDSDSSAQHALLRSPNKVIHVFRKALNKIYNFGSQTFLI
uniref:Uncharacterized protein n=1 Tax=Arundo donax TaxID=35708 RepID=A0A0A9E2V1_ARUDO